MLVQRCKGDTLLTLRLGKVLLEATDDAMGSCDFEYQLRIDFVKLCLIRLDVRGTTMMIWL